MSKNSNDTKHPKYKELYGTIMQATTFDTERKNLQWLTNRLFEKAKEDLQIDNYNATNDITAITSEGKTIQMKNYGSLEHFNSFIKELKEKHEISIDGENLIDLQSTYHTLKGELKKTRVLGVGKNFSEKMKTIVANTFERIIPKAILGAFSFATGPILAAGLVATGTIPVSTTGKIRSDLKKQLKQTINGENAYTEALNTGKKIFNSMLGIENNEEPKKLKKVKLWKKPEPTKTI